ncbi:MAG: hypothetical protein E7223_05205 [Clostridiales bacterium]|nr:hypothetical protein [Clostridiales bacterium]
MWAVVLFRLLCPVSLSAEFSLFGLLDSPAAEGTVLDYIQPGLGSTIENAYHGFTEPDPVPEIQPDAIPGGTGTVPQPGTAVTPVVPSQPGQSASGFGTQHAAGFFSQPLTVISLVWLCGFLGMVLYSIVSFLRLRRSLMSSVPLGLRNVYLSDAINVPFVLGILRPRIYLPGSLSEPERQYIILHEQHHIHRLDHLLKMVAFLALCLHWFNPLVWVAFLLAGKDMEMSCDEAVIRKLGSDIRADYAASLLSLSTGKPIISGTPLAFGEGSAKSRIRNLKHWKQPKRWILLTAALLCLCLLAACGLNPSIIDDPNLGGRMETFETVRWRITLPSGLLEHYVVSDGTGSYDHCWKPAGSIGAVLTVQDFSRNLRDRLEELEGQGFTADREDNTAVYENSKVYFYAAGNSSLYEIWISTSDPQLFAKLETAAGSFTLLDVSGRAGMPTLPENVAAGTEHLYDFFFADRYTYRMESIYSLYLPDGALPDTKVLTLYQEFVAPASQANASVQTLSGDGMVPHEYKLYRYDSQGGTLQLETHFYEPDQLEFLSSILTTLPGSSLAFGDPAQSSVTIGSSEDAVLKAFPEHLYYLETGSRQVTTKGELMVDRNGAPVEYDSLFFYQPYQNNDGRDITFYMRNGKVVCMELCSPFELRYVYGVDREAALVRNGRKPVPPVTVAYASEALLSGLEFRDFTVDDSEYSVQLLFTAQEDLTDLRFSSLTYETGSLAIDQTLEAFDTLSAGDGYAPIVVFYGDLTSYCLSFKDAAGRERHFEVSVSGRDGSLVLNEIQF